MILHSADGGETWNQQHTDIDNDLYTIVYAHDSDTLWVVGQWGVVLRQRVTNAQNVNAVMNSHACATVQLKVVR